MPSFPQESMPFKQSKKRILGFVECVLSLHDQWIKDASANIEGWENNGAEEKQQALKELSESPFTYAMHILKLSHVNFEMCLNDAELLSEISFQIQYGMIIDKLPYMKDSSLYEDVRTYEAQCVYVLKQEYRFLTGNEFHYVVPNHVTLDHMPFVADGYEKLHQNRRFLLNRIKPAAAVPGDLQFIGCSQPRDSDHVKLWSAIERLTNHLSNLKLEAE